MVYVGNIIFVLAKYGYNTDVEDLFKHLCSYILKGVPWKYMAMFDTNIKIYVCTPKLQQLFF